ncbi:DUF5704 domain-containing protein [Paenibacillus sp. S150]|uniref:DUF5704 domain-containing protein n=1 Tax=Paenibacillus sp. S150 TaxID=2749826 RepID=UPI001C55D4AB|nr:DUF5704 domain-containing protein [Paenibacillus sp. S150]MBW4081313.1 hypothetical protein [Paenibacillus sp. S150]
MEGIKQSDQLYLYAIMIVTENGRQVGGKYYTLDGIKGARAWGSPGDLDDYYGVPVTYNSPDFPIDVVSKMEDGTVMNDPAHTYHKGDYKAGEEIEHTFNREISYDGKAYEIVRSYIVTKNNPEDKKYIQEKDDANVLDRHINVYLSGADIVAEYKEADNPVKAIYQTEDGTPLKEVDKGKFAVGAEATHTFEAQVSSGGESYEIIRSFIINNNKPNEKQFIQEKTDPKLRERSITVASGGSNFVGIYKIPSSVTVTSWIEAPAEVNAGTTMVNGQFIFDAAALKDLKSYEITRIENANFVQPNDRTGTLSGKSASKTIPIQIPFTTGTSVTVKMTVVARDVDGNTGDSTADHTVIKTESGGGNPQFPPPGKGEIRKAQVMDPQATGMIRADQRGAEKFNVLKGIPTSESLYVNASAKAYLFQNEFAEMSGVITYPIQVSRTYTLTWTDILPGPPDADGNPTTISVPRSDTVTVNKPYNIQRSYSYWIIDRLEVYGIQNAAFNNYAFPSGTVMVQPSGYSEPSVTAVHEAAAEAHITHPVYSNATLPGQTVSGGFSRPAVPSEDWKGEAEKAIGKIKVTNDSLIFNGNTVMDNRMVEEKGAVPGTIPEPASIGADVLYGKGYVIDKSKTNKADQPSTGTLAFTLVKGINGGVSKTLPINGINPVTVHTPVVNYAVVSDDRAHNQKTTPSSGRSALILDRSFTVTVPTTGQHRDISGYGNRDFAKYVQQQEVWFPFDVYSADRTTFIPKQTWTQLPLTAVQTTFFLPVWVDEGNYDVLFRTFAENSPAAGFGTQMNANLEVPKHIATQTVAVEVVGRLYDFRITDIADYNWETVFRTSKGSAAPTGNAYWVGLNGIDGTPRGNASSFVLPVRQGSHPEAGKKNVAVKTGYHFKFDVKSKGNMFGSGDGIRITPTFYFVDSKGKNRQEVDLYYHSSTQRFIRIGSNADVEKRYVTLDDRFRNVPQQQLINTASSFWNLEGASGDKQAYINGYLNNAKKQTYVGGYDILLLPQQLRSFIGSMSVPEGVNPARANASVQQWYGEYSLPANPYVVPKGTDLAVYGRSHVLDDLSPIFLRNGYIVVNFNLETIRDKDVEHPHLQYIHGPLNNQWKMEGFQRTFTDAYGITFQLKDGDLIFYHADLSSYDDFGSGGTH